MNDRNNEQSKHVIRTHHIVFIEWRTFWKHCIIKAIQMRINIAQIEKSVYTKAQTSCMQMNISIHIVLFSFRFFSLPILFFFFFHLIFTPYFSLSLFISLISLLYWMPQIEIGINSSSTMWFVKAFWTFFI